MPDSKALTENTSAMTDKAIDVAVQQVGKMYEWGAEGPNRFDCSGLLWYSFKQAGFNVGSRWTTTSMLRSMASVPVKAVQPGDFLFPHTGHVVMYIGGGRTVQAPRRGYPVRLDSVNERTWFAARRFATPGTRGGSVVSGTAGGVVSSDTDLSNAVEALTNPHTWLRVAYALGGGVAIIVALMLVNRSMTMPIVKAVIGGAKAVKK